MKIKATHTMDSELASHFGSSMDHHARVELTKEMTDTINKAVNISFKKEVTGEEEDHVFSGHVYVLSEHDYQSISQDFDILIKVIPRYESSLKAILRKIHHEVRIR